jgi:hypothetical protein
MEEATEENAEIAFHLATRLISMIHIEKIDLNLAQGALGNALMTITYEMQIPPEFFSNMLHDMGKMYSDQADSDPFFNTDIFRGTTRFESHAMHPYVGKTNA